MKSGTMKKKIGFSVRVDQQEQTLAAVSRSGPDSWNVDDLSTSKEGTKPPQQLLQPMVKNHESVTWLMPNDLATASVITLPPLKGKELTRAVTGYIARNEQGSAENFSISWNALASSGAKTENPRQLVFALYSEKKEINEQLGTPLALGIKPARMTTGFMVLDQFYRMTHPAGEITGALNLVFLGQHENFLVISRDDCPVLTRGLPFDLSEDGESEQYLDQLATEIDRSGFYVRQGEHSPSVAKIIVAGNPELADRLVNTLQIRSDIPAETWDISTHFQWGDRPIPSESFIPLMAAALSVEKFPYNLLPEIKRSFLGPKFRRRALVAAGSLAVALLPVLLLGGAVTAKVQEGYLEKANQRLDLARLEAEEAAEVYKKQRLLISQQNYIQTFLASRPDLESILLKIGSLAPAEVQFRDLRVNEDELGKTRLTITGESKAATSSQAHAAFIKFQQALEGSDFLVTYTEPIKLEINGESSGKDDNPRTVFRMKFLLITDQPEEG